MTDYEYIARLQRHLADYKTAILGVAESGVWGTPPRSYAHILPARDFRLNIVAPHRDRFWAERQRRGWKLHRYFHHLSSSQALAFNLFFPVYPEMPARMMETRRVLGLPPDGRCQLEFEAVLDACEGTNIDALISTAEGQRTIIEIKLTERTFGKARADERHLSKLKKVYRPLLAGRVADSCLEPPTFFGEYQLFRNLAQIRRDSSDRVVLVIPRARPQLWRHAMAWCDSPVLGSLRGCVTVVALEDVVEALAVDSAGSTEQAEIVGATTRKYIPAG